MRTMLKSNYMKDESTREVKDRELFDRISGGYWLKDLLPAHRSARQCRLEQTIMSIPVSSNITILEVGCGAGFSAEYLRGKYHEYCGIDYSDELIKYLRPNAVLMLYYLLERFIILIMCPF
jgi:SAM-dependent methyltransferase